ncbi:putative quinol monooxygenase [Herbiconiux sp. P17]|uniref:putative quinol monooxygenase n=1 Tax=Herbiconiux wuyangfengii TaxID=3342794 RepID=UPI0035B7C2BC
MGEVRLGGYLVCASQDEARIVTEHLPEHVALTRGEPGCLAFDVTPTDDPLAWRVDERFHDEAAFAAHQARAAESNWGRATAGIERRYSVEVLPDTEAR